MRAEEIPFKALAQGSALVVGAILFVMGVMQLFQWVAYHVRLCLRGWAKAELEQEESPPRERLPETVRRRRNL